MIYEENPLGELDKFEELILDEKVALSQILSIDKFLDIHVQRKEFANFLIQNPAHLKQLVRYCIEDPCLEDMDENALFKYPFYSSEFFRENHNQNLVLEYLFLQEGEKQTEILSLLFGFLDQENLNETNAGYFVKILKYFTRPKNGCLFSYLHRNNLFEAKFFKHLSNDQIADVIGHILKNDNLETLRELSQEHEAVQERIYLFKQIIERLDKFDPTSTENPLTQILIGLLSDYE